MEGDGTRTRFRGMDEFKIGDFVWGKIHGQLWWPGQVCDPSNASEQAGFSENVDHHVLVAYFGDNTFAWSKTSLLKPFKEEFQTMVEQNSSQSFADAVNDAIYEVERSLRSDMTCYCVPEEKVVQFRICRKNNVCNASVSNYSPVEFLHHLQDVAQDVSVVNMLDVALMRSWAASFYLRNGCFVKLIEDLFDEKRTENWYNHGREFQMDVGRVGKRPQVSRDEASRKKRSLAELILLQQSKVEEKVGAFEDETKVHINPGILLNKKKKKRNEEEDKVPDVEVIIVKDEEENGFTRRERKKSKYLSPPYTTGYKQRSNSFKLGDSEASENDSENSLNLKTMFPTSSIDVHEASLKEYDPVPSINDEASTHDILGELLCAASNPLYLARNPSMENVIEFFVKHRSIACFGILELHQKNKVTSRRRRRYCKDESKGLGMHQNGENMNKDKATSETRKIDYCTSEEIDASKARLRTRRKRGTDEAVRESEIKIDQRIINSSEGRLVETGNQTSHVIKDSDLRQRNAVVTNGEQNIDFDHIMYDDNLGRPIFRSKRTRNENSVALLLTFSPGTLLPSKDELFLVFSKYGALIKHETELFRDSGCARVVFARETDAKKAINDIKKSSTFPFSIVNCQSLDLPQCPDIPSTSEFDPSALISISKDLQRMVSTLTPNKGLIFSHGLKPELREELTNDIKDLLNKVNKLI